MRKYNSSIKTAFISEAGSKLEHNEYFGFVELDKYACYVIADGITDMREAAGAKTAISAVIDAFQKEPGISKRKIKGYLKAANKELIDISDLERIKGFDLVEITRLGRNFIMGRLEEPSAQNSSEGQSEVTPASTTPE